VSIPVPPEWLEKIPLVGAWAVKRWLHLATASAQELRDMVAPYLGTGAGWFLARAGSVGMVVLQFLLTVIIAAILYAKGEKASAGVRGFARRLGGQQGEEVTILSARAVRGVALGVILTALIQAAFGGIGLFVAGVPAAVLLAAVMLILCIIQIGPGLVMVPCVIWLFWSGENFWGAILIVWTIIAGTMDNLIRPVLIKKGADLPLLLIFAGVIGGLIALGIIGLFIGPVILAVTYTLLSAWVRGNGEAESSTLPPAEKPDEGSAVGEG